MGALEIALIAAAVLIGMTGTWSPCGFSMIETIGPTGHTGGRSTTIAACLTFLPGALAGGVATFWLVAVAGELVHGAGGQLALLLAAALAIAAAVLEARGTPIVPQIRRQLPEHWRRTMPMPVASALYGGLLGLGFTTFVLTFGVWALAGIAFALGEPATGLAVGLAFGVGRALPIVGLAPFADRPFGHAACETMAMRPGIYRGFRIGDAVALLGVAGLLVASSSQASAQEPVEPETEAGPVEVGARGLVEKGAADPSVGPGGVLAFQRGNRNGVLRTRDGDVALPGKDPAAGGPWVAVRQAKSVTLLDRNAALAPGPSFTTASQANAIAVSRDYVVYRTTKKGKDKIAARLIKDDGTVGDARTIARSSKRFELGRPSVGGNRVAYAVAKPKRNRIVTTKIGEKGTRTIASSDRGALQNPAIHGPATAYVAINKRSQNLLVKKGGRAKRIAKQRVGNGIMWSTTLGKGRAFYTLIKGSSARIVSARR